MWWLLRDTLQGYYNKMPIYVLEFYFQSWWQQPTNERNIHSWFILYFQLDTLLFSLRTISAILFPLHVSGLTGPFIRRSKLYMQPTVFSPSADVFVLRPLRKNSFFLYCCTTKTSAEGENTIRCMYNLDLLMMGLWGLKHVEERG